MPTYGSMDIIINYGESSYTSWTLGHIFPNLNLVISRWLACVALSVPKHQEVHYHIKENYTSCYFPQWFMAHKYA